MAVLKWLFGGLGGLLLLAACTVTRPEAGDAWPSLDLASDAVGLADLGGGAGSATDYSGKWFLRSETANCVNASGAILETLNRNWYLLELRKVEDQPLVEGVSALYEASIVQCRIDLTPVILNIAPSIPDAVLDGQGPQTFYFTVTGSPEAPVLTSSTMVEQWGVILGDPVNEELPVSAEDPRVVDEDGDGNPGITMILGDDFCEMYMVQRTVNLYFGVAEGFSKVVGTLRSEVAKNILGGTEALCLTKNTLAPNPPRNQFMLIRADGNGDLPFFDGDGDGKLSCQDLRLDALTEEVKALVGYQDLVKNHKNCEGITF